MSAMAYLLNATTLGVTQIFIVGLLMCAQTNSPMVESEVAGCIFAEIIGI